MRRLLRPLSVVAGVVIAVFSLVPGTERPPTGTLGDVAHLVVYMAAALITRIAFPRVESRWHMLGFSGAAAFFEICQIWIPWRSASLDDWIASTAGTLAGIVVAWWIAHRRCPRPAP